MSKIELDKYYTPLETAKYCIDKAFEIIGIENITHVVEPSAGAGAFSTQIPDSPYYVMPPEAYDIEPEHQDIVKQDFLKLWLPPVRGRLIIGNPPFGNRGTLIKKFFHQACGLADYIAWILPIGYLDNTTSLYEFDLIYSEDLGVLKYSGRPIHCCFNIYKRPDCLSENKRRMMKLKSVSVVSLRRSRGDHKKYDYSDFDLVICGWGSVGKVADYLGQYEREIAIKVNVDDELKEQILDFLRTFDWGKRFPYISVPIISVQNVITALKERFPELE